VEEMKENIIQLKKDIVEVKTRQDEATKDIKRIERDMKDFDSNKDAKLAELQVCGRYVFILELTLIPLRNP
jgi:structural maintenance of chromosome 2